MNKHEFITKIESHNTGGNVIVDLVTLESGVVIGISADCICIYRDKEAFDRGDADNCIY